MGSRELRHGALTVSVTECMSLRASSRLCASSMTTTLSLSVTPRASRVPACASDEKPFDTAAMTAMRCAA